MGYGKDKSQVMFPAEEIKKLDKAKDSYKKEVAKFTQELAKLKKDITAKNKKLKELDAKQVEKEGYINKDITEKQTALANSLLEAQKLDSKLTKELSNSKALSESLTASRAEYEKKTRELESSKSELDSLIAIERKKSEDAEKSLEARLAQLKKNEASLARRESKLAKLEEVQNAKSEEIDCKIKEFDMEHKANSDKVVQLKAEQTEIIANITSIKDEEAKRVSDLEARELKVAEEQAKVKKLSDDISEKDTYLVLKEKSLDKQERDLVIKKRDITNLIKGAKQ